MAGAGPKSYKKPESAEVKHPSELNPSRISEAADKISAADNAYRNEETRKELEPGESRIIVALRAVLYFIIFVAFAGKFFTGSYLREYEGKWIRLRTYFPAAQRLYTEAALAKFDGSVSGQPVYLAIDGDVYDVTKGKAYQPGGPYDVLTGVDAARAFGTGCFKTHRTHDLRGLSPSELKGITHWKRFYENHKDYFKVGTVSHPPIDPSSPIPEHCNPDKDQNEGEAKKDTPERREMVRNKAKGEL